MPCENTLKGGFTCVTAPTDPYATDAVVYTTLFFFAFAFDFVGDISNLVISDEIEKFYREIAFFVYL